jgi:inorganic phosphate transporter, PiT family
MIKTFGHGLVQTGTIVEPAVTLAVLIGAIAWVLFASRTGLPVSTTHALTGAIVGTGFVAFAGEGLIWSAIGEKIAHPLLLGPFLAFVLSPHLSSCSRAREEVGRGLLVRDAGLPCDSGH